MNNKGIIEELAEAFFITGEAVSKFVKITYNFHKGIQFVEGGNANCTSQQSTYVWSETALYLLGPKALYWFTLSAIRIDEVDVTIELPCLCNEVYNKLLSRLTYLVCKIYNHIIRYNIYVQPLYSKLYIRI